MIDRLSNAFSLMVHVLVIVLLGRMTFAADLVERREAGMEIEIVDFEYAMPDARPAIAEAPAAEPSALASETLPWQQAMEAPPAPNPAPSEPNVPAPAAATDIVEQTRARVPVPAPALLPTPAPKAEAPAQSASTRPTTPASDKPGDAPRLDAAALARSSGIANVSPATQTRLNSATIGSAIGEAAPRGVKGLTFRQKVDLAQKVRDQVMPCWNPPSASEAGLAIVRLRFRLDRDGRVVGQPVQSGVTGQTEANAAYINLLTNSGRRAILMCAPLELPPELFEAWAQVEVEFNPRDLQ